MNLKWEPWMPLWVRAAALVIALLVSVFVLWSKGWGQIFPWFIILVSTTMLTDMCIHTDRWR